MKKKLIVPKFATEAEEAKWWDDHMNIVEANLTRAIQNGTAGRGTAQRILNAAREATSAESRNVTLRMAEADLNLARKQAEEKGLPCQTYIKSVLHEALLKRERGDSELPHSEEADVHVKTSAEDKNRSAAPPQRRTTRARSCSTERTS